jgi:hypothetical protein
MTKWDDLALRAGRHNIAYLHGTIRHNDTIDQQLDQLAPLAEIQTVQDWCNPRTERAQALRQAHQVQTLLRLRVQVAQLRQQPFLRLAELLPLALKFLPPNHLSQVDLQQPSLLPLQLSQRLLHRFALRLECLRQSLAPLRTH